MLLTEFGKFRSCQKSKQCFDVVERHTMKEYVVYEQRGENNKLMMLVLFAAALYSLSWALAVLEWSVTDDQKPTECGVCKCAERASE